MRHPGGYAILEDPDLGAEEWDTRTCAHCNKVEHVPHGCDPVELGGLCYCCMGLICSECVKADKCDPLEAKLERWERRDEFRRSLGG